ncbi:MAG: TIGR01777 family oxidoreductase [Anaerolineae bacterium]|nr:TIGR01777 family oxidoreductase [Anaerolineae bacterium]
MRIIITGGTGLIGQALAASLAADGHDVIALSRSLAQTSGLPAGVRVERWDARTADGWGHLADGADAIVNLAGATIGQRWTVEHKRAIRDSRLNAGRAVVEAVEQARVKPRVVVQASGIGYYGPHGDELLAEDAPPGDDFLGRTAVEWEASTAPVEAFGVRRAVARTAVVLSLEGGSFPLMLLPFRLFAGGPFGNGRQWFPWIHIADQVQALRFLIENQAANGPFNLVSPGILTNNAFAKSVGRVMGRPAFFRVPAFAPRLALGEMASLLLDGQNAVPQRLLGLGFTFRFAEFDTALRDLLRKSIDSH